MEILPEIACDADKDTKAYFDIRFHNKGVPVYTNAKLAGMEGGQALIRLGEKEVRIDAGTLVFSVGSRPEDALYDPLVSAGIRVIKVGDSVKPARILDAVHGGLRAGDDA